MKPTVGRIVHYKLSDSDAQAINKRRTDWSEYLKKQQSFGSSSTSSVANLGYQSHVGNQAREGQVYPLIVVVVWDQNPDDVMVNGQVLLDGNDTFWATSRHQGDGNGQWVWPPKVES